MVFLSDMGPQIIVKLIIQIPCYNEAETLAIALAALPRQVSGFDTVEWLIVDDGSSDATAKEASDAGVDQGASDSCGINGTPSDRR